MLLRFGCENYKSISEYQEIMFTASKSSQNAEANLFSPEGIREKVLPIVALYGANGSGKTNLISALRFMTAGIINSARKDFEDYTIPRFKLDNVFKDEDSTFDIDFILDGIHYHYGFSLNESKVVKEWLYSFSYKSRMSRSVLFYRDVEDEEEPYYFGKNLKGKNKAISEITGDYSLFLSVASQAKHETLGKILSYFKDRYNYRFKSDYSEEFIAKKIKRYELEKDISRFLSLIDVGASSLVVNEVEIDDEKKKFKGSLQNAILSVFSERDINLEMPVSDNSIEHEINIYRKNTDDELVLFKFRDESLGTRSLISLLASVFWLLKHGGIFVVDELESSLHTLLSLKVVELFNNAAINPNGAQLIFTTHETQLLNFNGVRKDEVWLTEKCKDGSTHVAPLSDYGINKKTNLRNGYLDGRFGAIPFLGLVDTFNLFEEEDNGQAEEV